MSAFGGKADITDVRLNVRFRPKADITQHARTPQCTGHSSEVADVAASSGMSQEPSFAIHTVFIRENASLGYCSHPIGPPGAPKSTTASTNSGAAAIVHCKEQPRTK